MSNSLNCFKQYSELAMASYAYFDIQDMVKELTNIVNRYFIRDKFEEFFDYIYNNFFEDYYHFVLSYNFASDEQKKILNKEINELAEQYDEDEIVDTARLFKYSSFAVSFFKKYKVLYHISNNKTGFSATLFEKIKSEEYSEELKDVADKIISFRGTDDIFNDSMNANIGLISNKLPIEVYADIIKFIQYCINSNQLDYNDNIAVTGHSLGGALSQLFYATFYKDFKNIQGVYTFNSPGIVGIEEHVKFLYNLLDLKKNNEVIYDNISENIDKKLKLQIDSFFYQYIDYVYNLYNYLSNNYISNKVYHFHTGNTFEYEKEIINLNFNLNLLYKFSKDVILLHENMTPDELMSHFQYVENVIQNLNDDIEGVNYMLNINMKYNYTKQTDDTNNSADLSNNGEIDNKSEYGYAQILSYIYAYSKKAVRANKVILAAYGFIKEFYDKIEDTINTVVTLGQYAHSILSSILVLNFYNYLYLCKLNHLNDYTVDEYIKLFNIYTYKINDSIFSNDKYIVAEFSTDYSPSIDGTDISYSYFYGDYLLDHKYNQPIIDIIKYIYLFAQAYSEHEGIEDENLHNCINSIEQILTSKIYDYSNVTIEIINILSKHNIYCKLIYDTERNEYENTNDISSKFIKYYRISFVPMYKNQSMITENTLTHIFGYNLQEMLSGCDDEFIALFPLQTVLIS